MAGKRAAVCYYSYSMAGHRVKQYVGRALRTADGKQDARVYDYVDSNVGILASSYRSRFYKVYNNLN